MKTQIAFLLISLLLIQLNLFTQENKLNSKGEKVGIWKEYFEDGKLAGTGVYKEWKKEGKWTEYSDWHHITLKVRYKNGKKEGKEIWYRNLDFFLKSLRSKKK